MSTPADPAASAATAACAASAAPAVLPAVEWRFPSVSESALANGMRVLVYHCPGQYLVHASLFFDVPLNAEPAGLDGVAGLVARCLTRGARAMTADAFSDALASAGADLDAAVDPDGFAVRLSVPVSHLARGLELMAMAVSSATYAGKELEQEKRLRLQEIEQAKAYPGSVTVDHLNRALLGSARAARPVGGTTETVEALGRDDVTAFAAAHLQPSTAVLIVAGDFGVGDPVELVAEAFDEWAHSGGGLVLPEDSPVSTVPRVLLVDWPDAPQATIRIAGPGITRGDARWPALFVANYVVGGSFGSRLNTVLREEKGFTYGVSSTLDSGRRVGLLGIGASVQSNTAGEAVGAILAILDDARRTLRDDEVAVAVRATSDSAALGFERADAVVGRAELLVAQRLPLDHVDSNLARIRAVTTTDANAAYGSVVLAETLTVVVAADATAVAEPLRALGHASVEVVPRP